MAAQGETANLALLACEEGRAWEADGNLAHAEQCWQRAEQLSRTLESASIRADVLLQLGRLDHLRSRLASALDRYEAALEVAAGGAQTLELELRRLLVRLDLNPWDQVRATVQHRLKGLPPDRLPEEIRPLAAMVAVLLHDGAAGESPVELGAYRAAARGDVAAARRLYHQALATASSPERRARQGLALGLLALAQG